MLKATNVPSKPVLAIHTGSIRRQVKLEENQPFLVPYPGSDSASVEVSLFDQLASQLLPDDGKPQIMCSIPVRRPDGVAAQVTLRIRRGMTAENGTTAASNEDSVAVTKDYLDHHQLQQRVQGLIQDVLRDQPLDPYRYMLEQLHKVKYGDQKPPPKVKKEPLVPKPPEKPRPNGSSRPIAGGRLSASKVTQPDKTGWSPSCCVVRLLLESPPCLRLAEENLRGQARRDVSVGLTTMILEKACENAVARSITDSSLDQQVKVLVKCYMKASAVILSPEYQKAIVKWSISSLLYQTVNVIGRVDHLRESCLDTSARSHESLSLPSPVVLLDSAPWATWFRPSDSRT